MAWRVWRSASAGTRRHSDPDYPTQPLERFEPLVRAIFGRPAHDPRYTADWFPELRLAVQLSAPPLHLQHPSLIGASHEVAGGDHAGADCADESDCERVDVGADAELDLGVDDHRQGTGARTDTSSRSPGRRATG